MGCCCSSEKESPQKKTTTADSRRVSKRESRRGDDFLDEKPATDNVDQKIETPSQDQKAGVVDKKPPSGDKFGVALYDYTANNQAELTLQAGDRVRILEDKGGSAGPHWKFVTRTGEFSGTGYVPKAFLADDGTLEAQSWYFGKITRREAEEILNGSDIGTFLVRGRTDHHSSGKAHDSTADRFGGGYFLSKTKKYATLSDLVEWYKRDKSINALGIVNPAKRQAPKVAPLSAEAQSNWREIPRFQIALDKQIGKGNFGFVYEGLWNRPDGGPLKVAIKVLKKGSAAARNQFIKEALAMKNLNHKNLVQLYGIVSTDEPYWLVQEFVKDGSLLKYLQSHRATQSLLSERLLVNICAQIACGMCHLEKKSVVHRDLAARNVLVNEIGPDNLQIKIADFGLAKMIEHDQSTPRRKRVKDLPTKWTAPEALSKGMFSSKSDVWSYGIVLHEVFTHGKEPYEVMSNAFVRKYVVQSRQILRRADGVPERVYEQMTKCFMYEPADRPTFKQLYDFFNTYYGEC